MQFLYVGLRCMQKALLSKYQLRYNFKKDHRF